MRKESIPRNIDTIRRLIFRIEHHRDTLYLAKSKTSNQSLHLYSKSLWFCSNQISTSNSLIASDQIKRAFGESRAIEEPFQVT